MKRLIPVALAPVVLTGCVLSAHTPPAIPAQQFVTTLMLDQVPLIQQAQNELAQVSRVNLKPKVSPSAVSPLTISTLTATPKNLQPSSGATALAGQSVPALKAIRYMGVRPGNLTLAGVGRAQSLRGALQQMVPAGWTFVFSSDLKPDVVKQLQWTGHDQWPYVLDAFLLQLNLVALVDWSKQQISVADKSPAFIPGAVAEAPQIKPTLSGKAPALIMQTKDAAVSGRNPFSDKTSHSTVQTVPSPVKAVATVTMPKKVAGPRIWRIEAGSTLKDTLFNWASGESCSTPGVANWTVGWLTPVNYRIDAPLQFEGSFKDALNSLFTLYGTAKVPLYAGTKAQQCVLLVDDKEIH